MKFTRLAGAVGLAIASSGCTVTIDSQGHIVREEKSFEVSGPVDLRLETFDGSIQVEAWDKPKVRIEVEKRGATREAIDALEIVAEQKGNSIEFQVRPPREETFSGIGVTRRATARLIVSLPARSDVRARSGDGSMRAEGISGRLEFRTGDGSMRLANVAGDVTLTTGDGLVTVSDSEGRLEVNTGDGGVNVSGTFGGLKLLTGDGTIVVRARPGTVMTEDWELTSREGSVSLYLPDAFDADIDAQTGDGTIRNEFIVEVDSSASAGRRMLRASLGTGGKRLRIRTDDGGIRIRRD